MGEWLQTNTHTPRSSKFPLTLALMRGKGTISSLLPPCLGTSGPRTIAVYQAVAKSSQCSLINWTAPDCALCTPHKTTFHIQPLEMRDSWFCFLSLSFGFYSIHDLLYLFVARSHTSTHTHTSHICTLIALVRALIPLFYICFIIKMQRLLRKRYK